MHSWSFEENLNRTAKVFLDEGSVGSVEEAEAKLRKFKLVLEVGDDISRSPTLQAMLLTAINTGRRCFLGGIFVRGNLDCDLIVSWQRHSRLIDAVIALQGLPTDECPPGVPKVLIGDVATPNEVDFAIRATFEGWSCGVAPVENEIRLRERQEFVPSGIVAGALAVAEVFRYFRGNKTAGKKDVGLSLWQPAPEVSWLDPGDFGPALVYLPSDMWIIGLGHLGQSYLWTLGLLPYADPGRVNLILQDFDVLKQSNDSSSPLTFVDLIGKKKTRAMAAWCEERGFKTSIIERIFDGKQALVDNEPKVALCGVDNAFARAKLEDPGFKLVIEAGLGNGAEEFTSFQIHSFPGPQLARVRWKGTEQTVNESITNQPAYQKLLKAGIDECGITILAGRSVGASFVGTAAGAMVISELLRFLHGGSQYALIDASLNSLHNRNTIINSNVTQGFNPGFTGVIQ